MGYNTWISLVEFNRINIVINRDVKTNDKLKTIYIILIILICINKNMQLTSDYSVFVIGVKKYTMKFKK